MCERWVGDWTNCNILTPSSFVFSNIFFSFCSATQTRVLRAHSHQLGAGSLYSFLSPTNLLQLTGTFCRTGLCNCFTSTCFLWALLLHPIKPIHSQGYTLIFLTGCPCSWIDRWVEGYKARMNSCLILLWNPSNVCASVGRPTRTYIQQLGVDTGWSLEEMRDWMILFTNPSARAGYDTMSIFKRSLTGLNSEFSFS